MSESQYVLVRNFEGQHFEAFCDKDDPKRLMSLVLDAEAGTLGGHKPQPMVRYAARLYFNSNRILIKLTHNVAA